MAGPLIPKKLRVAYEALEARHTAALLVASSSPGWALVADLQDELADLYRQISAAAHRDPLVANAFSRAAQWAQRAAHDSRRHVGRDKRG